MRKVLIVDPSQEWTITLADALRQDYQVACCSSGAQALRMISSFVPDVLILELMLPEMDGIGLLQAASAQRCLPATVVTGRYFSDYLLDALARYSVDYVAQKPCSVCSLTDRVHELMSLSTPRDLHPAAPEDVVSNVLLSLGAITSQNGFYYLRDGILLKAEDPSLQLTKNLYPAIGDAHRISGIAVEKSIRTAISTAYRRRDDAVWRIYFSPAPSGQIPRPTNGQFIARLAEAVAQQKRMMTG